MPVRVLPSSHGANPIPGWQREQEFAHNETQMLKQIYPKADHKSLSILQSSFSQTFPSDIMGSENGLVYSILQAYNHHHHLVLRADDIWFAILTQLSVYINKNAEELREKFVRHQGKKELELTYLGTRFDFDFGIFARDMSRLLEENIVDPEYREWILPRFSTSTPNDEVVASVIMMASLQKYFDYRCQFECGIPSVTLLGEKSDYQMILTKLEKLPSLGQEPAHFAKVLRPVVKRLIRTFEKPEDASTISFWRRIVDVGGGSGSTEYSGWVTAFCFWDDNGRCLHRMDSSEEIPKNDGGSGSGVEEADTDYGEMEDKDGVSDRSKDPFSFLIPKPHLVMDRIRYPRIDQGNDIPTGWSKVPVKISDNGVEVEAEMVAGLVGIRCLASGDANEKGTVELDTMQPESGWWIYEKLEPRRE